VNSPDDTQRSVSHFGLQRGGGLLVIVLLLGALAGCIQPDRAAELEATQTAEAATATPSPLDVPVTNGTQVVSPPTGFQPTPTTAPAPQPGTINSANIEQELVRLGAPVVSASVQLGATTQIGSDAIAPYASNDPSQLMCVGAAVTNPGLVVAFPACMGQPTTPENVLVAGQWLFQLNGEAYIVVAGRVGLPAADTANVFFQDGSRTIQISIVNGLFITAKEGFTPATQFEVIGADGQQLASSLPVQALN
jgi:hypothetical protein